MKLGGEDSNPQWQGQNLLCCRLHHPRSGDVTIAAGRLIENTAAGAAAAPAEPAGGRRRAEASPPPALTEEPAAYLDQPAEPGDPPDGHLDRLFGEVGHQGQAAHR